MPDIIDRAQELQLHQLECQIMAARSALPKASAILCEDCGTPIPEARRSALVGVDCCVHCQQIREHQRKHFRA